MKNFTLLFAAAIFFVTGINAQTQRGAVPSNKRTTAQAPQRCGVDEMIQQRLQTDPAFRAKYEQGLKQYQESMNGTARADWTSTLSGPVTIPIVVHIVIPDPTLVTDADVLYFVNRLNIDYSGFNPDSLNASTGYPVGNNFMSLRGHSLLRWKLAARDPSGNWTYGIERRANATMTIANNNPQNIKSTAAGGLDAWDVTQYYNLWVGVGQGGLLGIAPEIGPGGPAGSTDCDGVCVDYRGFSRNPGYTFVQFCGARTAVHEIGHNMGLFHTFQGGCGSTTDFGQLTNTTAACSSGLPANLLGPADDTPAQNGSTSGCLSGPNNAGCAQSPLPPGKMYQSYMDYTDDPGYSMFTKGEVDRMHYVLETCRPGYLTTLGGVPGAGARNYDAGISEVVRPGGSELLGSSRYIDAASTFNCPGSHCSGFTSNNYSNPTCAGPVTPKVRIKNYGVNNITSIHVFWTVNGTPGTGSPMTVSIPSGGLITLQDTVVTLPSAVTLGVNNTLKFWTSDINFQTSTQPDQSAANDTTTKVLNFGGATLPLQEGFENATFPPAGWSINNPNGNVTWARSTPGHNSTANAMFDNYNFSVVGQFDDIVSPPISAAGFDSLIISWDFAHKNYPGLNDQFSIVVSTNCGASFSPVFTMSDPAMATAGSSTADYPAPGNNDWVTRRTSIGQNITLGGQVLIGFRNINGFGNRLFIDNINISAFTFTPRDLSPQAVLNPQAFVCNQPIVPSLSVKNTGTGAISSVSPGFWFVSGPAGATFPASPVVCTSQNINFAPNATQTVTYNAGCFPTNLAPGTYTVKFFTTLPNGQPDLFPANDTITQTFTIRQLFTSVSEGFESATFPPPTMTIINPAGDNTWQRAVPGRASQGRAMIDNYNFAVVGNTDDMQMIPINTAGVDSVLLSFDVAHKNYPGLEDFLSVVASVNCGNSFLATSYNKPGSVLATAGSSTADYATPGPNDWRTDRMAVGGPGFMSSGSIILAIRNTNGFGNRIHIDNINITRKFKRDLRVVSVNSPKSVICNGTVTPSVTISNIGSDNITSYNVVTQVDNSPVASTLINTAPGAPIAPGATVTISLPNVTIPAGPHTFTVYTASPVSLSGTGDLNTSNDTLRKTVTLVASVNPPVVEGFESTTFPPTGWGIVNPDNGITWQRTTQASSSGIASAYVNNFAYANKGAVDELWTPQVTYTGVDSVSLSFDVAAITFNYPGSTAIPLDTLEVLITKDCGNTFTSIYKKWGNELQTIGDPSNSQPFNFFPTSKSQWRTEYLELTGLAAGNGPLQVLFRNSNNNQNNIFIDNVNLKTRTLPAKLKAEGVLVLPSPFQNQFTVWHYLQPTNLKFISVYNSAGQLIWKQEYSGNADKQVTIDMSGRSAGVYIVHMGYTDSNRNTSIRIVKF